MKSYSFYCDLVLFVLFLLVIMHQYSFKVLRNDESDEVNRFLSVVSEKTRRRVDLILMKFEAHRAQKCGENSFFPQYGKQ